MTAVVIAPRREDLTSDTEAVVSGGWFQIRPSKAYAAGGQWVQPLWPDPVNFTGSAVTVQLDPLVDVPYELYMELPTGRVGQKLVVNEFRFVAGSGPVGWETLTQVTGPDGGPVLGGALEARVTVLESEIGTVSGGATTLSAVTGISTDAKTLIATPNSFATMLGLLSAAPAASPTLSNPTFTGTVTVPDGALAIADTSGLQTALDAKAPLASPALTGAPTAPTATAGTNTTQVATTAFVLANAGSGAGAPLASPAFTGTPTAPTATAGTNTTQLATTAFVTTAANAQGNTVYIDGYSSPRTHPVTGAALPAYPACGVIWVTHGATGRPPAALTGDLVFNEA